MSRLVVAVCLSASLVAQTSGPGPASIEAAPGTFFFGLTPQLAVSLDGQSVVFVAHAQGQPPSLWVRPLASGSPRQIAGTDQASYPFWSHDGRSIGFFASGKLKTVPAVGGTVVTVCDAPTGRGGTWNAAGVIVFASGLSDPLRKVFATGGTPEPASVIDVSRENSHRWPQFLPDGQHLLFWAGGGKAPAELKIAAVGAPASTVIGPSDSNGAYGAGHVFFKRGNALVARRIDPSTFTPAGDAVQQVVEPISSDAGSFFASFAASPNGALLFTRGTARPALLTWLDRQGASPGTVGAPGQYTNVTMSPDGRRLAVSLTAGSPANRDIWIVDLPGGAMTRLTSDTGVDATPVWSPGSDEVIFSSTRSGIYQMYRRPVSGASTETLLVKDDRASIATDWSRDGTRVLYTRTAAGSTGLDIWVHFIGGASFPLIQTKGTDDGAAFSADGRWVSYQSNESGQDQIYLQLAPTVPPRVEPEPGTRFPLTPALPERQVSVNGGTQPRWRHDGRELFYLSPEGAVMAVDVPDGDPARAGQPRQILPPSMTLVIRHSYTTTVDGQRMLMPVLDQSTPSVITVSQWR